MFGWLRPKEELSEQEAKRGLKPLLLDAVFAQSMGVLTGGAFLVAFALLLGASLKIIGLLAAIGPAGSELRPERPSSGPPGRVWAERFRRLRVLRLTPLLGAYRRSGAAKACDLRIGFRRLNATLPIASRARAAGSGTDAPPLESAPDRPVPWP